MKYFACSDIHGGWQAFATALVESGYDRQNPNHQLIAVGDLFGRAAQHPSDILKVYDYLRGSHANPPIVIHGNHEYIVQIMLRRGNVTQVDQYNGEHKTIQAFGNVTPFESTTPYGVARANSEHPELLRWLEELPHYYETKNYVFVHGVLPQDYKNADEIDWYDAEWADTIEWLDTNKEHIKQMTNGKTLVFGHFGSCLFRDNFTSYADVTLEDCGIYYDPKGDYIALDSTTVLSHRVNMFIFEE